MMRPTIYILLINTVITFSLFICSIYASFFYERITAEDALIEWMTAVMFLVASLLFFRIVIKEKKRKKLFPLLLAILSLITFLEEINYGQRILGLETPSFFLKINQEGEMNFHNIVFIEEVPIPFILLCYFIVIPFMLKINRFRTFFCGLGYLRPPLSFIVFVIMITIFVPLVHILFDICFEEVAELLLSIIFIGIAIREQQQENMHIFLHAPKSRSSLNEEVIY